MKCEGCGAACDLSDRFCRNCGLRLGPRREEASPAEALPGSLPVRRKGCAAALMAVAFGIVAFALLVSIIVQAAPDILKLAGFKPRDLGVNWSAADFDAVVQQCGVLTDASPAGTDKSAYRFEFTGEKDVDWAFTDSQITAWMNTDRPGYWPFSDVQFKIHNDNTMEVSFVLDAAKLMTDKDVTDYLSQDIKSTISGLTLQVPVYAEAKVTFKGPKRVSIQVLSIDALGMSLTEFAQNIQVNSILEDVVNAGLDKAEPVQVQSFTTSEGSLSIKGKWYALMQRVPAK